MCKSRGEGETPTSSKSGRAGSPRSSKSAASARTSLRWARYVCIYILLYICHECKREREWRTLGRGGLGVGGGILRAQKALAHTHLTFESPLSPNCCMATACPARNQSTPTNCEWGRASALARRASPLPQPTSKTRVGGEAGGRSPRGVSLVASLGVASVDVSRSARTPARVALSKVALSKVALSPWAGGIQPAKAASRSRGVPWDQLRP